MKVLHLLSETSWRGGEQQAAYLIDYCLSQQIKCHVACRKNSAFSNYCQKHQIPYTTLPFKNSLDLLTAWQVKKLHKQHQFDLIHPHTGNGHSIAVLTYLLGCKLPLIVTRRVCYPVKNNRFSRYKFNCPAIKKIVCVSKAIENLIRSSIKRPDRCCTVYSGIDLKKFKNTSLQILRQTYDIADDQMIIGNIAALEPDKGLLDFINAAEYLVKEGVKAIFFIIGEGSQRHLLEQTIKQKKLSASIKLTGFIDDIPQILPELDVYVMSSVCEGLGTSLLDAIACNVPVVGTNTGGIPEIIEHEVTGLLASVNQPIQLAEQIKRLVFEPELRKKVVPAARAKLQQYFTKERMAASYRDIYYHS